jgi:hypothetical protein
MDGPDADYDASWWLSSDRPHAASSTRQAVAALGSDNTSKTACAWFRTCGGSLEHMS